MQSYWTAALVATALAAPAHAQSGTDALNSLTQAIGGLIANSRLQREVAAISAPLVFVSGLPVLDAADRADPRNFDVAGIRLGMSPGEVRDALRRAEYQVERVGKVDSFDTVVRKRSSTGPEVKAIEVPLNISAKGDDLQEIDVRFAILPEGPVVESVKYIMLSDAMSSQDFAAQIARKYGESEAGDEPQLWCAERRPGCSGRYIDSPFMRVSVNDKSITLTYADKARDEALERRLQAEIEKRRAKVGSASF